MKKNEIRVFIGSILLTIFSCTQKTNKIEIFAENIIEAFQNNDLKQFKANSINFELAKSIDLEISKSEIENYTSDYFIRFKNQLISKNINIKEYKIFEIREPYKKYKYKGRNYIRFYVILKNNKGNFLKLDFVDCLEGDNGYVFADDIYIRDI